MADELVPDEVVDSSPIDGSGANLPPDMFPPVDHWSEADPDYEDIPAVEPEEDDEEEVPEGDEEPYGGPEDADPLRPYWVRYELHGRNLDSGEGWEALATADFNGDFEVAVEHLTAGARWEFRLRLIDRDGRPSKWSEPLQITLPTDFTPPPAPTAPVISNVHGYTTMTWDGELTGERPEDFSHVVAYVRQMHPEGDPEGEPGDPRRVGTLSGKGDFPLLQFLGGVLHEAHFTAVDTSGNESPWSDTVQFTPTPPVDAAAIEQELEEARQRLEQAEADFEEGNEQRRQEIEDLRNNVIPGLEQSLSDAVTEAQNSIDDFRQEWEANWDPEAMDQLRDRQDTLESDLTTGLTQVHNQAEAMAEAARDDAVSQAAANAQSEYDRLQELAEKALSRAGDNVLEDPSFETDLWVGRWDGTGNRSVVTSSESRTGDQSVTIGGGSTWNLDIDTVDVEVDDSWRLSIWYKTEGSPNLDNGSGTVLRIWEPGAGVLAESSVFEDVGDEWTRAVLTFTIPEGLTEIRATLYATHTTGLLYVDDMALQEVGAAAEALRLAEVARQQAEAAHIAAGNAVDAAANAYDAASSKSTVHWSLSAPSGTADNSDDVWWQYELRNGKRVVIGQWFWDNGVWRETEIAEEWLPRVNIGTGTYGDLHGDRLEANTVKAGALAVMPDSADFAPGPGGYEDLWTVGSNNAIVSSGSDPSGAQLRVSPSGSTASRTHGPWIRAQAGDTIYYRMYVGRTNTPDAPLRIYFMYDGSYTSWDSVWRENASGWVEGVHTVPDHVESTVAFSLHAPGGSQGNYWIRNMEVRKQVKGVLIEPEGIKSPQVDTAELTASSAFLDNAMVNLIQGRMANFDQAIIGNALIKDNSISAGKLTVMPDSADFAPNPGEYPELWSLAGASLASTDSNPTGVIFRFGQRSGDTQIRGPYRPVTPGRQIRFRGRYTWWGSSSTGATVRVRMEWYADESSSRLGYDTFISIPDGTSAGWVEGTVTVPEDANLGRLYLYQPATDGSDAGFWGNITCEPMMPGVLIEPEGIKSPQVDTQEFFSSSAVIDRLSVATARAMEITAERGFIGGALLEDNSVTADKIVVTEELVGRFAQFLVVEADMLAANAIQAMHISAGALDGHTITGSTIQTGHSMSNGGVRIVSSGSTYRIQAFDEDGQERFAVGTGNAFFRGRLHAGPSMSRGVAIDYGLKLITTGWTDIEQSPEILEEHYTPYVELVEEGETYLNTPMIYIGKEGGMNITPGRYNGTPPGSGQLRLWGHTRANKLISRHLEIPTNDSRQPGGMFRDGPRTRISGRTADQGSSTDMFVTTNTGPYSFESGRETRSGSTTWAAPPPLGVRRPIAQAHSNSGAFDAQRTFSVTTYSSTSSGFSWRITRISGTSGNNQAWIRTISAWT